VGLLEKIPCCATFKVFISCQVGKVCYIISGDQEIPTRNLAKTLGIDNYFAEVLPEDKADLVGQLQQKFGRKG